MMKIKHSESCKRVFARYDKSCPRCLELIDGAPAREGWGDKKQREYASWLKALKAHDCKRSGCAPICVAFDW